MGDEATREANVQQALTANPGPEPDLDQIYREHHRRVVQAAYRVTGNAHDAEDVLQTVFMRLVRREGGSPLSDSLGNYLHRAAINAALDIVRSKRSARVSTLEGIEPTLAAAADEAPDKVQDGSELKQQIRLALGKMSGKAAEIFALRYFEGYGNHEIAKMLGTSRSTVNVILHRTREKLRKEMSPYLGEMS
jgi:RNA polymerase sigma-70 factor (ECF subfamily)